MKINIDGIFIDEYTLNQERICSAEGCQKTYRIIDYYESSEEKFYPPINYVRGCFSECLECWLNVSQFMNSPIENQYRCDFSVSFPEDHDFWYDVKDFPDYPF